MGGGFRSVPPTGLPEATLEPGKTRRLPTQLVSLSGPTSAGLVALPAKGEKLQLGSIDQLSGDAWARAALRRLAEDKAPPTVAQLVMWHVNNGFQWATIAQLSRGWANAQELALARAFATRLREAEGKPLAASESASIYWDLTVRNSEHNSLASELRTLLDGRSFLGLAAREHIPARPGGPALALRVRVDDHGALAQVSSSSETGEGWVEAGSFPVKLDGPDGKPLTAAGLADALAERVLGRLATVRLQSAGRVEGKPAYKIRIENGSPVILNALALAGPRELSEANPPAAVAGLCVPPHKGLTLPVTAQAIERLGLKEGIRVLAVDLSGL
jgi:hypothetical protein